MNKLQALAALAGALRPANDGGSAGSADSAGSAAEPPGDLVVCCNGMIGRELYTVGDRPGSFYMIGSMGLGLSIALGLALARPTRRVISLDGDGNVLMGMNALASVGSERPANLYHVVLDNQAHASTGGQRTISGEVKLEAVARAAGYRAALRAEGTEGFAAALREALGQEGPVMVLGVVDGGTVKGIGRVRETPPEITARFCAEARR
jgi:thiamine pyrophosphate-dependent acetolactate synthase large subunit-like protein